MTASVDTASALTITELSGQGRTVRLAGRALPYRPFDLEGTQRINIEYYGGNPQGSPTVMGGEFQPTKLAGYWKDKYLGQPETNPTTGNAQSPFTVDGTTVDNVRDAARITDSIRAEGQLCLVTWDEQTRQGFLRRFKQSWHNRHDLEWEIDFEWIGDGDELGNAVLQEQGGVSEAQGVIDADYQRLVIAAQPDFPPDPTFISPLDSAVNALATTTTQLQGAVHNLATQANDPLDAVRRTVAVLNSVSSQAQDVIDVAQGQPAQTMIADVSPGSATLGQSLRAAAFARATTRAARQMKRDAIIRASVMAATVQSSLLGTYIARDGDDLRDVSRKFYQTPFEWRRLMTFNELSSAELDAGQLVLVPRIPQGGTT